MTASTPMTTRRPLESGIGPGSNHGNGLDPNFLDWLNGTGTTVIDAFACGCSEDPPPWWTRQCGGSSDSGPPPQCCISPHRPHTEAGSKGFDFSPEASCPRRPESLPPPSIQNAPCQAYTEGMPVPPELLSAQQRLQSPIHGANGGPSVPQAHSAGRTGQSPFPVPPAAGKVGHPQGPPPSGAKPAEVRILRRERSIGLPLRQAVAQGHPVQLAEQVLLTPSAPLWLFVEESQIPSVPLEMEPEFTQPPFSPGRNVCYEVNCRDAKRLVQGAVTSLASPGFKRPTPARPLTRRRGDEDGWTSSAGCPDPSHSPPRLRPKSPEPDSLVAAIRTVPTQQARLVEVNAGILKDRQDDDAL